MQYIDFEDNGNSIELQLPEEIYFAFNKSVVMMSVSGLKRAFVHIGSGDAQYDAVGVAINGTVTMDVSSYIQSIFDDAKFNIDQKNKINLTNLCRIVSFHFGYELEDGTIRKGVYQTNITYIWGALMVGETFGGFKQYTAWKGYPFSFPIYISRAGLISGVLNRNGFSYNVDSSGLYAFVIAERIVSVGVCRVTLTSAETIETTFSSAFDSSFQAKKNGEGTEVCLIDFKEYREGVYLRWIDRHGTWKYWLFERGDESKAVTADGEFIRSVLGTTSTISEELGYSGRRKGYEVERTIELCAPLVDSDTYDMLSDISSSPVVDLWLGDDYNNWMSVTIKEGTYQKTRAVLQDFICNMVLNDIAVQRL